MALAKGINSYANVAEADSYFEDRLDVAAWIDASDEQKAQALVTATRHLDNLDWIGIAVSSSQNLAFPRVGTYFDPRLGYSVTLDNEIPKRIVHATFELAYHFLNNDGLLDDTGQLQNLQIGTIKLDLIRKANKLPYSVDSLVSCLRNRGTGFSTKIWWRAN
jgi:hypothetical protein